MPFFNVSRELIRSGFVRAFRVAFETCTDFRYKTNPNDPNQPADDSGIFIYDAFPWTNIKYPSIIVTLGPGDPMLRTIGGEMREEESTPYVTQDGSTHNNVDFEIYGGGLDTSVILTVMARSGIERSRVMDWIQIYIRHLFVRLFQKENVSIAGMSQGSESQILVGNDPVYTDTVTVKVYSEFEHRISTELAGTINGISILNVFSIMPNGATT